MTAKNAKPFHYQKWGESIPSMFIGRTSWKRLASTRWLCSIDQGALRLRTWKFRLTYERATVLYLLMFVFRTTFGNGTLHATQHMYTSHANSVGSVDSTIFVIPLVNVLQRQLRSTTSRHIMTDSVSIRGLNACAYTIARIWIESLHLWHPDTISSLSMTPKRFQW
jgi:hypothetical protein